MSLADVMSAMHLPVHAEVGLLVFVGLFAGVVASVLRRKNRATFERARFLPLEAEATDADGRTERTARRDG